MSNLLKIAFQVLQGIGKKRQCKKELAGTLKNVDRIGNSYFDR